MLFELDFFDDMIMVDFDIDLVWLEIYCDCFVGFDYFEWLFDQIGNKIGF